LFINNRSAVGKCKQERDKGSVSVYLIIVIVPIFMFVAVLIDFARVGAAGRESELAVKAGVRSAMSAFDTKLQAYGLYGLTLPIGDARQLFETAVSGSLPGAGGTFLDTTLSAATASLQPQVTLGFPDVFRTQVLEEMKYRAPIEFALEATDKLQKSGMAAKLTSGQTYKQDANRLEQLIDRRESALDDVWSSFGRLHTKLGDLHASNQKRLQELNALADQIGMNTVENVQRTLNEVKEQEASIEQSIRELNGSIAAMATSTGQSQSGIQGLLTARASLQQQLQVLLTKRGELEHILQLLLQYAALIATTRLETEAAQTEVTNMQEAVDHSLSAAKQANDELRAEWNRLSGAPAGSAVNGGSASSEFGSVRVLPDEYFSGFQADVAGVAALFGAYARDIRAAVSYADEHVSGYMHKNDAFRDKSVEVYDAELPAEREREKRNETVNAKKRELWGELGSVLDQAKQAVGGCQLDAVGETETDSSSYDQLKSYAAKYEMTDGTGVGPGEAVVELKDPKRIGSDALNLGGLIANALTSSRDAIYVNEYALTKFNDRTYGLEKDGKGQVKPVTSFSKPEMHLLAGQEAEYAAYGFYSCSANIASAYGEMFAIRLAVRTIERLSEPQNELLELGSPLLVLLAAAAEGAADALQDMNKLVHGEEVPFSSKLAPAVTLTYQDYLRLLLLVHGGTSRRLARLQALVELDTGLDLTKAVTQIQGSADTSVKLWFLPGAVKLLGMAGLTPCRVQAGRCDLRRSAMWRY
jgi:archaellum component FlaC